MQTRRIPDRTLLALAALVAAGCATHPPAGSGGADGAAPPEVTAVHARAPVTIDGVLDDAVWRDAPVYTLTLSRAASAAGPALQEQGRVRFAWDATNFYMAVDFDDSDAVNESDADGGLLFNTGDLAELFLWPEEHTWYWELYVTPNNLQSALFFPGPGRKLPSCVGKHLTTVIAAKVRGTLNDWSDRDRGWTAEMAVPVKALTARGEAWGPGSKWRLLVGRYNYSVHLPVPELSALPTLPKTDYHLRDSYARLVLADN
jgi:hypothetical protein